MQILISFAIQMNIIEEINKKYRSQGHDPDVFLQGLFYSRPLAYWDYIELDTLLTLQKPRTNFPDEKVFIIYHQAIELFMHLIIHELEQLLEHSEPSHEFVDDKLKRILNYLNILQNTFTVMNEGMEFKQYSAFRLALAPSSGFQSVQYRIIEIMATAPKNLLHRDKRNDDINLNDPENFYDSLYWREAGIDKTTGMPGVMLKCFDEKYKSLLCELFRRWSGRTLFHWAFHRNSLGKLSAAHRIKLKEIDYVFNVSWPLTHLKTAYKYLVGTEGEPIKGTGASHWHDYLHPAHQKRIFFPFLFTQEELENWGKEI